MNEGRSINKLNNQSGVLHIGAAILAAASIWSTVLLFEDQVHIETLNAVVQDQAKRLDDMELRVKIMQLRQ